MWNDWVPKEFCDGQSRAMIDRSTDEQIFGLDRQNCLDKALRATDECLSLLSC